MKQETITFEYEHCGECPNADYCPIKGNTHRYRCFKTKYKIPDLWGEIPKWCPLEDKREL